MNQVKRVLDHVGSRAEKFFKATLFQGEMLLLGVNCLEPGQMQAPHVHDDQDKFYYVVEGEGRFWLGEEQVEAGEGQVVWAAAGVRHGVENVTGTRLTLLVGMAPPPAG